MHEEVLRSTLEEAVSYYTQNEPRGEYVLVIEGRPFHEIEEEKREAYADISIEEHVSMYEAKGFGRKEAMKKAAADRGVSKRDIYNALL